MNNTNAYYAAEIKAAVKMPELLRFYGFNLNAKNRMPCPFHNGKDNNFGVKDNFYHCFVCGEKGDIFTFMQKVFELSFSEALTKLNDDFAVGLPIGEKLTRSKQMELGRKSYERKKQIKAEEERKARIDKEYWAAYDRWLALDNIVRYQRPAIPSEATPEYIAALLEIENAKYNLECAEKRRWEYEQAN